LIAPPQCGEAKSGLKYAMPINKLYTQRSNHPNRNQPSCSKSCSLESHRRIGRFCPNG